MDIESFVQAYYDALRNGDDLAVFFLDDPQTVKFGISEALHGYSEIASALREQTRTTSEWEIESKQLVTESAGEVGWFSDVVTMQWFDQEKGEPVSWESRWSGTVCQDNGEWRFVRMHVSATPS